MKKQNGITLISLIITIIIMLILAGTALSIVMGEGSVIDQATSATDNSRGAEIYETVELAVGNNKIAKYSKKGAKTKQDVVDQLYADGKITADEKADIEEDWKIKIGNVETDFTKLDGDVIVETPTVTKYKVRFLSEDGSTVYKEMEVVEGEFAVAPTDPDTYYGSDSAGNTVSFLFSGWGLSLDSSSTVTVSTKAITADTNFYAKYIQDAVCFVAGTKVLTEDGLVNIENIKTGDKVYTLNLDTNQREIKEVQEIYTSVTYKLYEITVNGKLIEATPRHKFYVVDKGWIRAHDLVQGDVLVAKDNTQLTIDKIELVNYDDEIMVYNFNVEDNHNYLITELELLVHNTGSPT